MGVDRFIFVDDRSTDGTAEWLVGQPDVDLYGSDLRYGEAEWGRMWRDGLIDLYGRGRWYVCVDVDEFLVYPGLETRSIKAFVVDLEQAGLRRSLAPMLDIYPPGPLSSTSVERESRIDPLELATPLRRRRISSDPGQVLPRHPRRCEGPALR